MEAIEELRKAIEETEVEAVSMLKSDHHKAYTRTSASGKASSIAAKGPQTSEIHGQVWEQMKQRKDVIDFPQEMQTKAHKKAFNELIDHYNNWHKTSQESKAMRLHPTHVDNEGEINIGRHTLRHNYEGNMTGYVIESRQPHMNGKLITTKHKTFETAKMAMVHEGRRVDREGK